MSPDELKEFATKYSREIYQASQEMDTYQDILREKIENFVERQYTNFVDAKTDEEEFTKWLENEDVKEDMKFLSYVTSNINDVPNFKNLVSQEVYEKMVAKIEILKNSYKYTSCYLELLKDDNYLNGDYKDMSYDDVQRLYEEIDASDPKVEMLETMMEMLLAKEKVLNDKARIESLSIVESLKNRKGKISDEEVIDQLEEYENAFQYIDRTPKDVYHYFDEGNGFEISKEVAETKIKNGETISRYKGARTEGVVFNYPNEETGKLETKNCYRRFSYDMQEDMKENIRMLKDLQKDVSATDPWYMFAVNTDEFKNVKTSISNVIKAMEKCAKYPIDNNMNAVAEAMETMNTLVTRYSRRKNADWTRSGKKIDFRRYNIATALETFSSPNKIKQLKDKVFHVNPASVVKKLDQKYPKDGNVKDIANYLRGLNELSKMIPSGVENRDDKVGISYLIANTLRELGGADAKARLINDGGMTNKEYKDLEKQFNAGKPTKDEMARKVGDKFLEKSGALKAPEQEYDAVSVDDIIDL